MSVWQEKAKKYGWPTPGSEASTNAASTNAASNIALVSRVCEDLNLTKFHELLAKFIVMDDQVSLFRTPDVTFLTALLPSP